MLLGNIGSLLHLKRHWKLVEFLNNDGTQLILNSLVGLILFQEVQVHDFFEELVLHHFETQIYVLVSEAR